MKRSIILVFLTALSFASLNAQPKDWAQFSKYAQSNSEITRSEIKLTASFIGDSIFECWDQMDHEFFSLNNFVGRGISGQTSSHILVRFREDVINLNPKYAVILVGINDIALNNGYISKENILGNIISMCELAKLHKIKPVICSLLPAGEISWRVELGNPTSDIDTLNGMLKEYAKKNDCQYVDFNSKMRDKRGELKEEFCKQKQDGTIDRLHPSLDGYKLMEEIILKYLK